MKVRNELRKVEYRRNGDYEEYIKGYFHKFSTLSEGENMVEYAIVEDIDGFVRQLSLDEYSIRFLEVSPYEGLKMI